MMQLGLKFHVSSQIRWAGICLCLLTVWGAALRMYDLGHQSFWLDEGVSVQHATAITEHGYPRLTDGSISWESFPVHYLIASSLHAFPDVHTGARFMSAIAGIMLIPVLFAFTYQITGSLRHATVVAALMAFMSYEIAWSRQARVYSFLQLFSLSALVFLYRHFVDRKLHSWTLALMFLGVAVCCHRAGYLIAAIFFLSIMMQAKPSAFRRRDVPGWQVCLIGVVTVGVGVLALFHVSTNFSLRQTLNELLQPPEMDYAGMYVRFLWIQLGLLLPISLLGAGLLGFRAPRLALPLIAGTALYMYVISYRTILFAHRYAIPIIPFLLLFAGTAVAQPADLMMSERRWRKVVGSGLGVVALIVTLTQFGWRIIPCNSYDLGYTAPQPRWREAFAMVSERESRNATTLRAVEPAVVTPYPLFHDIYLGPDFGGKFYLPISWTGYPGEVRWNPTCTSAALVTDGSKFLKLRGYALLDDFGLRMLAVPEVQQYFLSTKPNAILPGKYPVYIWILDPDKRSEM